MERPKVIVNCIVKKDGKIVLIKRNKEPYINQWAFIGGKVEGCEKISNAALRETKEETGLDCEFVKVNRIVHEVVNREKAYVIFVCTLKALNSDLIPCDEGETKWFDFDELPCDMVKTDKINFEKYYDFEADYSYYDSDGKELLTE